MWKWLTILLLLSPAAPSSWSPAGGDSHPQADAITSCAPPSPTTILPDADGRYAPVFPGWGHHHHPISTTNDSAQFYFDQGLSLYYSFHLTESAASFKEAEQKDSRCAMAYWGEALAMGPYYNSAFIYKMPPGVLPVLDKMNALAAAASGTEQDLIAALNQRYSKDTTDRRRIQLNHAWSQAVKALVAKYPDDNDIKALYLDGMMTEHAWGMWDDRGKPRPWTPGLISYCEAILKSDPDHPAALHYYIHLLEASLHPEATLASAERLKDLMPGVAHMVHMASHSYQRTGNYDKGVAVNDSASAAQRNYGNLAPQLLLTPDVIHYDAVEAFCAMNGGMYDKAMESAMKCWSIAASRRGTVNTYLQYLSMMPEFVQVRMGKWQLILRQPTPDSTWVYASLISYFARGMAYLRLGNLNAALACRDSLDNQYLNPVMKERRPPTNAPLIGASVAMWILQAEIYSAGHRPLAAREAFQQAIEWEDKLAYVEPQDWLLPARQFAGACLLKQGKTSEAIRLYKEDLVKNPGNGWSLLGLAQAFAAQHQDNAAADYRARATTAFAHAEQLPPASAY